jgi:hypothetical protein
MKTTVSLLWSLLLSSTLFWAVPFVGAEEMISTVPTDTTAYCHLKFPVILEDSLSWEQPVLDPSTGNIMDFYSPCDYDPLGSEEIRVQRRMFLRGTFDEGKRE